jgi:hypothetical protein
MDVKLGIAMAVLAVTLAGCGGERDRERRAPERDRPAAESPQGGSAQAPADKPVDKRRDAAEQAQARSGASATAQPAPGSSQRAAIMDALRPAIERDLSAEVEFVVQRVSVENGWALVIADPQRPGGGAIPPPASYAEEEHDGLTVNAILRFSGGGWTLVDHAIGPTDVWYCGVEGPPRSLTGC